MNEATGRPRIIAVGSSSKKSGKSSVATFLVRELDADFALKVSSGSHGPSGIITDPDIISRAGTDTGALLQAGARRVIWVNAMEAQLSQELGAAVDMFGAGGVLVVEGNSALKHLKVDFGVFVMTVPFEEFKPSAREAVASADVVLVDLRKRLAEVPVDDIRRGLEQRAPGARCLFYHDEISLKDALADLLGAARGTATD